MAFSRIHILSFQIGLKLFLKKTPNHELGTLTIAILKSFTRWRCVKHSILEKIGMKIFECRPLWSPIEVFFVRHVFKGRRRRRGKAHNKLLKSRRMKNQWWRGNERSGHRKLDRDQAGWFRWMEYYWGILSRGLDGSQKTSSGGMLGSLLNRQPVIYV